MGSVVATMAALPIIYLIIRALDADAGAMALLFRPRTIELLVSSLGLAAGVALGASLVGLPLAWLTSRSDLPGARMWTVLVTVPLAIPSYVLAFALVAAAGPQGTLRDAFAALGLEGIPSLYGLPGALLVLILATYPYVLLAARAALLRADPAGEDAARSLGDPPWRAFRRVTLPLLMPAVAAGALLAALYAISDFGSVSILRFDSFARAIHVQYRSSFDRAGGAALALVLMVATFGLVWVEARVRRRAALSVQHGRRRAARRIKLGRWRWPALLLCATVVGLALVLPTATILIWALRGASAAAGVADLVEATRDSLVAGGAAALATAALALPLAVLFVRHRGPLATVVERLSYGAAAMPGICLALALVFLTLNAVPAIYQTLPVLVIGYALRFLPQATAAIRGTLVLTGADLTDAARSLGERPLGIWRTITVPLLRPGILAGATLVFLSTIKELPLTLLVAPTGFRTLATRVYDAATEGFLARAAVPALALLVVSLASAGLLLRDGETRS